MAAGSLSKELFNASLKLMPGGVNSPVRSFLGVDGEPLFMERGKGSKIYDADGREYIDYVMSWGPLIFGHANAEILGKVQKVIERGMSFGACTGFELELAKLVVDSVPSIEMVRFVNSGTEATMSAIRLARAVTDRKKIIKFDGCYHGHVDSLLVQAGSGMATLGLPSSPGVPEELTALTLSLPYNNIEALKKVFESDPRGIAAVIIEPVAGNMGVVAPKENFLSEVRDLCTTHGTILIFDEVMTGFRVAMGGVQEKYSISPDLTCLGKIIGGGMPVGAYGGRKELMEEISPCGPVYQAGTLSGNPVSMAAGIKTLKMLREAETFGKLDYRTQYLTDEMKKRSDKQGLDIAVNRVGSMFTLFFQKGPIFNYEDAKKSNLKQFSKYFHGMLAEGIYIPPSQFEAWFMSLAHSEQDIDKTIKAHEKVIKAL
ncbi:MAG: glutamate-1-semialdehyde 2,1-aminomutase [Bdellovibrionales bacterium]|nr:glutamate-1-semialdehyde 2,1-aminomutase [Bdellovibrionales bacterium]